MGAGLSRRQLYGRQYRALQQHMRTLKAAGAVGLWYERLQVHGFLDGERFTLYHNVLRASNGETAGILKCWALKPHTSENVINIIRKGR